MRQLFTQNMFYNNGISREAPTDGSHPVANRFLSGCNHQKRLIFPEQAKTRSEQHYTKDRIEYDSFYGH
ncbi:uncharacterized protein TrAtP1_003454 [Trichoderma atroviride]|uniref:uncharacterized protein n=1 Tax=Hypocrea atroviridis TaxID=63577 RepID=UPI00332739B2|nr:hypothetical protein TrAtP1_003454 [Trichoderma atroviride]